MHIKGVVFDLDHTLYDRDTVDRLTMGQYYEDFRGQFCEDCSIDRAREAMVQIEHDYVHRGWERMALALAERGILKAAPDARAFCDYFQASYIQNAKLCPAVLPAFRALKEMGLKLGLITNGREARQSAKLRGLGLSGAFDEALFCASPGFMKPLRAPFDEMARRLSSPAEALLYVGDNPLNDIQGARDAGYIPVWVRMVPWDYPEIEQPPLQIDGMDELPEIITRLNAAV